MSRTVYAECPACGGTVKIDVGLLSSRNACGSCGAVYAERDYSHLRRLVQPVNRRLTDRTSSSMRSSVQPELDKAAETLPKPAPPEWRQRYDRLCGECGLTFNYMDLGALPRFCSEACRAKCARRTFLKTCEFLSWIALFVIFGSVIGPALSYVGLFALLIAAGTIAYLLRHALRWTVWRGIGAVAAAFFLLAIVAATQEDKSKAEAQAAARAQHARAVAAAAGAAHEKRFAWNRAHPKEAAELHRKRAAIAAAEAHKEAERRAAIASTAAAMRANAAREQARTQERQSAVQYATISTPDGDTEAAFPTIEAFCSAMQQEGDAAQNTASEDMPAKADNIDASVGAQQFADGATVEVLRKASTTCGPSAQLSVDLTFVSNSSLGVSGWVFTDHLNK